MHRAPKIMPQLRRVSRLRAEDLRMDKPFTPHNPTEGLPQIRLDSLASLIGTSSRDDQNEGDNFLRLYRPFPKIIPLPVAPFEPQFRTITSSQAGKENELVLDEISNKNGQGSLVSAASVQTVYHDASGSPTDFDNTLDKIESENTAFTTPCNPKEAGTERPPEDNALQLQFSRSEILTLDRKMQSLGLLASMYTSTGPRRASQSPLSPAPISSWSMSPPASAPASPPPPTSLPSTPSRASPSSSNFSFCSSDYRRAPSTQYHLPDDSELYLPSIIAPALNSGNTSAEVSHHIPVVPNGSSTPKMADKQSISDRPESDVPATESVE
jgi:hypothetical protein